MAYQIIDRLCMRGRWREQTPLGLKKEGDRFLSHIPNDFHRCLFCLKYFVDDYLLSLSFFSTYLKLRLLHRLTQMIQVHILQMKESELYKYILGQRQQAREMIKYGNLELNQAARLGSHMKLVVWFALKNYLLSIGILPCFLWGRYSRYLLVEKFLQWQMSWISPVYEKKKPNSVLDTKDDA